MRQIIRCFFSLVALFFAFFSTATGQGGQGPGFPKYKPAEIVCRVDSTITIEEINQRFGTIVKGHQQITNCYLLFVTGGRSADSLALVIGQTPGVVYCSPNFFLHTPEGLQQSDPFPDLQMSGDMDTQEAVTSTGLPLAHTVSTGENTTVAVIDGGANFSHPFFKEKPGSLLSAWDYVDADSLASDEPGGSSSGHGTFVSGIIRLVAPAANIRVYRVLDTAGIGDGFGIASAVLQAIQDSCRVINLSLGMVGIHDALNDALIYARQQGVMVFAAAGNDSTDLLSVFPFPASRDYCVAVAATDSILHKADFSNYGQRIDICAPGTRVYAPYLDSLYAWWDGTSFSTPFVTGLATLLISQYPSITWDGLDSSICLSATAIDSLNPGLEGSLGSGLINMPAALGKRLTRGELTGDANVDIADLTALIRFMYLDLSVPHPGIAADIDCDGAVDISDLTRMIDYLYLSGPSFCQ